VLSSEAVDYYNAERAGLGYEFAAEVSKTIDRIKAFPRSWPSFSQRTRRCLISHFPYAILYAMQDDGILIGAIMHVKRDPIQWQQRLAETFGDVTLD
jgi:plasmid stabilization system protein ParE